MESGDHIVYLYEGTKRWEGNNKEIIFSEDGLIEKRVNPSEFYRIFEGQ